jgi:3-dehydroquinate dehydratase
MSGAKLDTPLVILCMGLSGQTLSRVLMDVVSTMVAFGSTDTKYLPSNLQFRSYYDNRHDTNCLSTGLLSVFCM